MHSAHRKLLVDGKCMDGWYQQTLLRLSHWTQEIQLTEETPRVNNIVDFGTVGYLKVRCRAGNLPAQLGIEHGLTACVCHCL